MLNRLLLAIILATILLGVAFGHVIDLDLTTFVRRSFANTLHAPGFGVIAIILALVLRRPAGVARAYLLAGAIAAGIGLMSELAQVFTTRDADVRDWINDLIGILAFLLFASFFDPALKTGRSKLAAIAWFSVSAAMMAVAIAPTAWYAYVILMQRIAVPQLLSFDAAWESEVLRTYGGSTLDIAPAPDGWPRAGTVGELFMKTTEDPVIQIQPARDWRDFDTFSFLVSSADGRPRELSIRINDTRHNQQYRDRFNAKLRVDGSIQRVEFSLREIAGSPRQREMDMSEIQDIIIFFTSMDDAGTIYIDDMRLN